MEKVSDLCTMISPNVYFVKNQNRFNHALYDFKKPDDGDYDSPYNYSKAELRKMATDYPHHYPALVSFQDDTFEISQICVYVASPDFLDELNNLYNEYKK